MISIVKDTNLTTEQAKYLNYTITYADETPIEQLNLLSKKSGNTPTRDTIVVTVEYKKDIIIEDLPASDITFTGKFHIDNRQANNSASARGTNSPTITYDWNYNFIKNGDFTDGLNYWSNAYGATTEIDNSKTYNGKASLHVLTSDTDWSGIVSSTSTIYKSHDYLFHTCMYYDSDDVNGGLNQSIRYYFAYQNTSGGYVYPGIATFGTNNYELINKLEDKKWKCVDKIVELGSNVDRVTSSPKIDNGNGKAINNYWVADVQLRIVEDREYIYNSAITTLPDEPTRTGYTFDGWYTDPFGGVEITTSTRVRESTTYYAHWEEA